MKVQKPPKPKSPKFNKYTVAAIILNNDTIVEQIQYDLLDFTEDEENGSIK